MPTVVVPKSDAEVFEQYYPYIRYLVKRTGIRPEHVEDYAMNLMAKFIEKGVLQDYDPNHVSGANFRTFLSSFVSAYLYHFAERDRIDAGRSRLSTDMTLGEDHSLPLMDYLGIWSEDDQSGAEVNELTHKVRESFRTRGDTKMVLFSEMVLLQVEEHGEVDTTELAALFNVTRSSIHNWLKKLREAYVQCM